MEQWVFESIAQGVHNCAEAIGALIGSMMLIAFMLLLIEGVLILKK